MEFLDNLQFTSLFITAIIATFYFYKYKHTELKLFLFLFWYIAINEIIAVKYWEHYNTTNKFFYNILDITQFSIIIWVLMKSINDPKGLRQKILKILLYSLWLFYAINILFENPINTSLDYAFIYGAIITVISIMYYLIDLIKSTRISKIKKDLLLWINIGFLIFNISYPIIIATQKFYDPSDIDNRLHEIQLPAVLYTIIIISNLVIIFGFIWSEKRSQLN
ncbi:hypothetical protein [uncultured Dokdonia sp.]|uniref:hypothetical protein n=1 Tax=uncultured Dokdonia sp. TaxID=575653 RepID=UPI0026156DE5|nr:hypothetical protein [uncultured Dokdonia sp.]